MAGLLQTSVSAWPAVLLLAIMAASVWALGRGADWLVDEAVAMSLRLGLPRAIVGATIVSLGTTTPEAAVSVLAAVQGNPGLALGNAVGSIICDTGLILGLAALLRPMPIDRCLVRRQGLIQLGAAVALILATLPWTSLHNVWAVGGTLPQAAGFVFLGLLVVYMAWSIRMACTTPGDDLPSTSKRSASSPWHALLKMALAVGIVLVASSVLIATATELAVRLRVPPSIVAATLVAFGTSLPELIIALTATWKGHGELAMGNIVGADILNVLFVAGAAAAVTPAGLHAEPHFFMLQFPAMLFVLVVFRIGVTRPKGTHLTRHSGALLLLAYILVSVLSYLFR